MKLRGLLLALVFALGGCGKVSHAPKRQELHMNLKEEPPTLDPRKAFTLNALFVIQQCFEGLTRLNEDNEPELALAQKVKVSDGYKRYIFSLKEAQWSDGEQIVAANFEESWKGMLDPAFPCPFAEELYILKGGRAAKVGDEPVGAVGVKALDDRTLQVDLEYPMPNLLLYLSGHAFMPIPANANVFNGPFRIKEHRHREQIVLEKNPHYWDKERVRLDLVKLSMIPDSSIELALFENGELDWAGSPIHDLPPDAIPTLKERGELLSYDFTGLYYYVFNTEKYPVNNARIRRALSLAINREEMIQNIALMDQSPALGVLSPVLQGGGSAYFTDHDVVRAREEFQQGLEEMGIAVNEFPAITISYASKGIHHQIVQTIQHQWQEVLGIIVNIQSLEETAYLDQLAQGKFQVAKWEKMLPVCDGKALLNDYRYYSNGKNRSRWSSTSYRELLGRADVTADPQFLSQAEEILMEEMPVAPIYFSRGAYVKKAYVKGVHISNLGFLDLKGAYINDKESGDHRGL